MGTKVQCKSYLPGYYSMRDLNEDASNGSWPLYCQDKTLKSGQCYKDFLPRPTKDIYLGSDKERLKQTMLQQEAIFRDQVYELHRLYSIQRDLMDKLKRKEVYKYPIPAETTQSSPFSSQISSEGAQRMWHMPTTPLVNSRSYISGADMQSPLKLIKENSKQAGSVPAPNGDSLKNCKFLESQSKKISRRMFDLQLPADVYIDSEEGEQLEEEKISGCMVAPENDVKLSLANCGSPGFQGVASRSDLCLQRSHSLADLNEPIQLEEATALAPVDFLGAVNCHGETQVPDPPAKPNLGFLGFSKETFQHIQKGRDNGTRSICLENERNKQEWLSYNLEAGKSGSSLGSLPEGLCPEKLPTPSEPVKVELKKSHEFPAFLSSDQSPREPWRERASCSTEISERCHSLANNYPGPEVTSCVPGLYPSLSQSDVCNSGSPSVSSWRKPLSSMNQNAIAVQELPSINPSAPSSKSSKLSIQSPGLFGDKWHLTSNLRLNASFGSEVSHHNGFCHGSQLESKQVHFPAVGFDKLNCSDDITSASEHFENHGATTYFKGSECMDVKSAKDRNLNVALQNGFRDGGVPQKDLVIIDGERKYDDPPAGLSWLRSKPACNGGPAKGRGSSNQMGLAFLKAYSQQSLNRIETGKGPSPSFIQDFPSALCPRDAECKRIELGSCQSYKKILGFPIFDKPHISDHQSSSLRSPSKSRQCPSEVEGTENCRKVGDLHIDLCLDPMLPESRKQCTIKDLVVEKGLDYSLSSNRNQINLNSCISEEETLSESSAPRNKSKIAIEIDLEIPAVPETEEGILPMGDCIGNQLEELVQSLQLKDVDPHKELVQIAAEAIVAISSSSVHKHLAIASCNPSEASLRDSLHWFAEVVSCSPDIESDFRLNLRDKIGCDHEESSTEGIDYFESMTLKLTETKVEEYWCKPQPSETPKEEETGTTSKPSRPRKGQGRRGRQRRDFQRDILPGLASLSRHEVTEDLQIIGGLMRATGLTWQTGLARRNAARNGWARGRRRSRGPAPTMEVDIVCPPPRQQPSELGLEERNLTGWGKTPTRPRRQRCPAGNPPPLTVTLV